MQSKTLLLAAEERYLRGEKLVYTDEVKNALGEYLRHLKDARHRLRDRKKDAERTLWGYGVGREDGGGKEKVMKEISRVYSELRKEVEEVGRDVEKLRGR